MHRRNPPRRITGAAVASVLLVLGACSRDATEPSPAGRDPGSISAVVQPVATLTPVTLDPIAVGNDTLALPQACDILLGLPVGLAITTYDFHTLYANPGAGSVLRLQPNTAGADPAVYECDSRDPNPDPVTPVLFPVDPLTLHPAKGNGPSIGYSGLTIDLNGISIVAAHVSPDPLLVPIGFFVTGANVKIVNSSSTPARITGFGHGFDIGGEGGVVDGGYIDSDATPGTSPDDHFGIETDNWRSVNVRKATFTGIKSINHDPALGQGGMVRRCAGGPILVENNYLEGDFEGLLVRECAGALVQHNFISSSGGIGLNTTAATGTVAFPNQFLDNVITNSPLGGAAGIALTDIHTNTFVKRNVINGFPCGIAVDLTTGGPQTLGQLATDNPDNAAAIRLCNAAGVAFPNVPPDPEFDVSCTTAGPPARECTFTDNSVDADGTITTRSWDFGDAAVEVDPAAPITHTYGANGVFTVKLTVTDDASSPASRSLSKQIAVADHVNVPPTADFTVDCTLMSCTFTDASTGTNLTRKWTFGEGSSTSTATDPTKVYTTAGSKTVTLTVTDDLLGTATAQHTANPQLPANVMPTANFTVTCNVARTCTFTNTSNDPDGTIVSQGWDFGDGIVSSVTSPAHTYATAGNKSVTLTVTDNRAGTNSITKSVVVGAANANPTANFTVVCTNLSCKFTNSSSDPDGTIASQTWTFGDGKTATGKNPTHVYTTAGTRSVTLTVTDNVGGTGAVTKSVTPGTTPPPSPIAVTLVAKALTATTGRVDVSWTGVTTTNVDLYQDGTRIIRANTGKFKYTNVPRGAHTYKVCNRSSTTVCTSKNVTF